MMEGDLTMLLKNKSVCRLKVSKLALMCAFQFCVSVEHSDVIDLSRSIAACSSPIQSENFCRTAELFNFFLPTVARQPTSLVVA